MANAKSYDDADVLITTYSKGGRGFDEESGCRNWGGRRIGLGILVSSTKKIEQPAGRYLRADIPVIFDIVDNQKNIKAHWGLRKTWYESRNGQLFTIDGRFVWSQHRDRLLTDYFESLKKAPALPTTEVKAGPLPQPRTNIGQAHLMSILQQMVKK